MMKSVSKAKINAKKIALIMAALMLIGCDNDNSDLQQFVAEVKATTTPHIEPYPEFKQIPAFQYTADEQRSPFIRSRDQELALQQSSLQNCLQPDMKRRKGALEAFGLDALDIQGFFTSKGSNWVLITANDGSLHRATVGDYLGLFYGRITKITDNTVHFTEQLPDGAGCWQEKHSKLTMSDDAGEGDNV